jgi:hypothetical protein
MKKVMAVLLVVSLAIPSIAQVNDPASGIVKIAPQSVIPVLRGNWLRTYVAADTTAANKRRDTVYTGWGFIPSATKFFPAVNIDGKSAGSMGAFDTLMVADSLNINFQTSMDQVTILATTNLGVCIPGSADLDTTIAYAATLARDSLFMRARWVRGMFVMKDSAAANRPTFFNRLYGRAFWLYVNSRP